MRKLQAAIFICAVSLLVLTAKLSAQEVRDQVSGDSVNSGSSVTAAVDSSASSTPAAARGAGISRAASVGMGRGYGQAINASSAVTLRHAAGIRSGMLAGEMAPASAVNSADAGSFYSSSQLQGAAISTGNPSVAGMGSSQSPSRTGRLKSYAAAGQRAASLLNGFSDSTRQMTTVGWPINFDSDLFSFNPRLPGFSPDFDENHLRLSLFVHPSRGAEAKLRLKKLVSVPKSSVRNPYATQSNPMAQPEQDPIETELQQMLHPFSQDQTEGNNSEP